MRRPDTAVVEVRWLDHCSGDTVDLSEQDSTDLHPRQTVGYLIGRGKSYGQDVIRIAQGWNDENGQWNQHFTIMAPFKVRVLQRKGA